MKLANAVALCLALATVSSIAAAQSSDAVVVLVRHAEKQVGGDDPSLTEEGKARAARWAQVLSILPVKAVYTTQFDRTRSTAKPVAEAHGLEPIVVLSTSEDHAKEMGKRLRLHRGETVVVVGHSNTIPAILKELGIADPPTIADNEYEYLFLCLTNENNQARLITLRIP